MSEIRFLGHAAFRIAVGKTVILVDPWITGNPKSPLSSADEIVEADMILVTHEHFDHGFDDAVRIAGRTGATIVAVSGLADRFRDAGVERVVSGTVGGTVAVGNLSVTFVAAVHKWEIAPPCGFILRCPDLVLYHSGDTAFFDDMALLAKERVDVALLPIGGTYTMDPKDAARAVEIIHPKIAVPMHYGTFPEIRTDPGDFSRLLEGTATRAEILDPGKVLSLV